MKKLFIIILSWMLILSFGSSAEPQYCNIEEIIRSTPDRLIGSYETLHGTVTVDVPVKLPAVKVFPVIKVRKMPAVNPGKLKGYDETGKNVAGALSANQKKYVWKTGTRAKDVHIYLYGKIPQEQPENVSLTYEETLNLLRQEIKRLWGLTDQDYVIRETRVEGPAYYYAYKTTGDEEPTNDMIIWGEQATDWGRYKVFFNQSFHGIEVNGGTFTMTYSDPEGIKVRAALREELEMFENDVPLLPFEEIKKSIASEIKAGFICSIENITLGYYPYQDAKDKNILWMLPAWYITGTCTYTEIVDDGSSVSIPGEALEAVIQAQTGVLCDLRNLDDPYRNASAVISWADVH